MSSPWELLANGSLTFDRVTGSVIDPVTGNKVSTYGEQYTARVYFKKATLNSNESSGVPIGSYRAEGYTVGILPSWCKQSIQQSVRCEIDALGKGRYYQQGKIHVVKSEVEQAGEGTQVNGYIVIDGGA